MNGRAPHGGEFFHAVGEDFRDLGRLRDVISADVLDAWFDPSPRVIEKLRAFLPELLRTSPPTEAEGLVDTIARVRGVPPESVLTGAGSSDLIFTCFPRLVPKGATVLLPDPVYGEYPHVFEELIGARLLDFELAAEAGFRMDTDRLIAAVRDAGPDVVALVNPNSPTGVLWPKDEVLRFLDKVPPGTLVLVDETYIDYAGAEHSLERDVAAHPNLLVIKSMSKGYGLSGLRAGYLVAAPALVRQLRRWMPPWSLSLLAQVAGVEALNDPGYYGQRYRETRQLRDALRVELSGIPGLRPYASDTNFLLVECAPSLDIPALLRRTKSEGVFVRECASISPRLGQFFRVAVKDDAGNQRVAAALRRAVGGETLDPPAPSAV